MRNIALFIIFSFFALPAIAAEQKCNYEPQPDAAFIEVVKAEHPGLDESQMVTIAQIYELVYGQNVLANDNTVTDSVRAFAGRTEQVAMKVVAIELFIFDAIPEMESVLEKMKAEEASGLKRVSDELKPEVRATARQMIAVGLTWGELSNEIAKLSADRFIALADQHGNIPDTLAQLERTMCTLEAVTDVMTGVADFFPTAVTLAYVEHLNY